jgi:hypothetical protein
MKTALLKFAGAKNPVYSKVEKILKYNLDSIPSPSSSVKIQIMGGKVFKSLLTSPSNALQWFALLLQVNFPDNNLNFH